LSEKRKVSRRRYLKYAAGVVAVVVVAGTGYALYEATRPPPTPPAKKGVVLWHTLSVAESSLLKEEIADYERDHPSVEFLWNVNLGFPQSLTEIPYEERAAKVIARVQESEHGSPPDLYLGDSPQQFKIGKLGKAVELDDYLKGWDGLVDIPKSMWNACSYKGKIIAIPQDFFVPVIFYNKDLFTKAGVEKFPDTWDELLETCKRLNTPEKGEYAVGWASTEDAAYWSTQAFLLSNGGGIYKDGRVILNSPESVEAVEFVVELAKYSAPEMSAWKYEDWDRAFTSGKLAIQLGNGSWNIGNYREIAPKLNYGIAPYPKAPRTGRTLVPGHRVRFYMPLKRFLELGEKFPLETYISEGVEFVKYFLNKEQQLRWCKALEYVPVRSSVLEDPFFDQPLYDAFKYERENAYAEFTGDVATIYSSIVESFANAYQAIFVRKEPVKEALDKATAEIEETIRASNV